MVAYINEDGFKAVGGSYLIEEGLNSNENDVVRKGWNIVEKNQEKISNLVMDMLTFSKQREPDMAPADLNQVTADVVELMLSRAEEAEVKLVWQPCEVMPTLSFDSESLHRAILNILTNAIDACSKQEEGCVTISTHFLPEQDIAHIIIQDNGEGIAPEDLKKIFSVFESRKGSRGTGLGLPVSQKILKEHGGDIRVESEPDSGSRFILELPAVLPSSDDDSRTMKPQE